MDPKRSLETVIVAAVLAVVGYFAGGWAIEGAVHHRKQLKVPDLRGKSVASALDALGPAMLSLRKDGSEFDASVPPGAVLRQMPAPGTTVREGKTVRVILSHGGQSVFVPTVSGLPLRNAEMLLRQKELLLGQVSESYSLRVEKGVVINQDPAGEQSAAKHSLVNVVVSGGTPPPGIVLTPDLRQKTLEEARAWADAKGVDLEVTEDPESPFPRGTVIAQEPAPDAMVGSAARVKLTVSAQPADADGGAMRRLRYDVPQGVAESLVRIVVVDAAGEREVFNGLRKPGSRVDIAVPQRTAARARIFVNGILVEEKELK